MGQGGAKQGRAAHTGHNSKKEHRPPTHIEELVMQAIQRVKKTKDDKEEPIQNFTKILLTTPKMNSVFFSVKAVFNTFDKDNSGTIECGELQEALSRLTMQDVTEDETKEFFAEVDVYEDGKISFKEFIVCLALGYVLNTIPALRGADDAGGKSSGDTSGKPVDKRLQKLKLQDGGQRPSFLMGEGPKIADAFSLVMDAYLTFDAGGKGYITKEDMHSFIVRLGARSPSKSTSKSGRSDGAATAFLTEERMNEMDWDKTGRISYSEFVYSFLGWVGFEDEDEDDEDEGKSGGGNRK
jgi:calcium-binding protein CML